MTIVEVSLDSVPLPPGFQNIDDFVAEMELEPAAASELTDARRRLAELAYRDGPTTLAGLRLRHGLSQRQLGELVGMSQSRISRLETCKETPGIHTARCLADALGVSLDDYYAATLASA